MLNENSGLVKLVLSILLFPTFFQESFILFAWGANDPFWIMMSKRVFLLLPVAAIILACWLTVACFVSVIIRPNRQEYVKNIFVTWWDLGKSIAHFWGGFFRFVFQIAVSIAVFIKVVALSVWSLIHEFILMPFRLLGNFGKNIASSPVPWIAVILTLFWCLIEAVIFTYVTTPLVVDTFSNITGENLTENIVRIPLFIFLLFVVLGSYAVLSNFIDSISLKNIPTMIGIGIIEVVVLFVEVVFLYREFVDALVPWFAQYSENFELGIFSTLAISTFVWFGIRSLSWFLFASHGTPTIMSIIQGKGFRTSETRNQPVETYKPVSSGFMAKVREDMAWMKEAGEALLASFMLPPLQIVGACINFCMLLINGGHLFNLPFETIEDLKVNQEPKDKPAHKEPTVVTQSPGNHPQPTFGEFHDVKTH